MCIRDRFNTDRHREVFTDMFMFSGEEQLHVKLRLSLSLIHIYAKDVLNKLPMEFAVEAQKLLNVSLEGTVDRKSVV